MEKVLGNLAAPTESWHVTGGLIYEPPQTHFCRPWMCVQDAVQCKGMKEYQAGEGGEKLPQNIL